MSANFKTIEWKDDQMLLIDQRVLPQHEDYISCRTCKEVATAIKDMVVRGAPAIGVTAAFGVALAARESKAENFNDFQSDIAAACDMLFVTRPTAVNLKWALNRMKEVTEKNNQLTIGELKRRLLTEAQTILKEDIAINRQIGSHGAQLIKEGQTILTHCNAGALATAGHGTALGVLYSAKEQGKSFSVFADETRPFLQGARLTAWELAKNEVPVTLITDNMAAYFMRKQEIGCVIVGADRIAANGDVANKIGTYNVAILAKEHHIPFYVAAPISTIDPETPTGNEIPIEERSRDEVTNFYRQAVALKDTSSQKPVLSSEREGEAPAAMPTGGGEPTPPKQSLRLRRPDASPYDGIDVRNPAFDVTPHQLITAIITEKGILREPYTESIKKVFE